MQKQKVRELGVHREMGIGSVPLGDKVNELCRIINLLLAERKGSPLTWQIGQSDIALMKLRKLEKKKLVKDK